MSSLYRILIFAPAFAPFANPEAIVNSKLALAFLEAGYDIDVVTRNLADEWKSYNYGSGWVEPWLPLKDVTHIVSYKVGGRIQRWPETIWSCLRMRHPVDGCRWGMHALNLALELHRKRPYDVIISRSLPDAAHLPAMIFAKKTELPWIANWNDASGDKNPPPYGKGPNANLGYFYERFLGNVAAKASWYTFPSDRMRQYICGYLGLSIQKKSSTIPHVAIKHTFNSQSKRDTKFSITHAGNISIHRSPAIFFKGLAEFIKSNNLYNGFKLLFIGLEEVGIRKLAARFGLEENLQVTGTLSYRTTLDYLVASDILLVIEAPCDNGIYLPAKFVDYVQTGRPILAVTPRESTLNDVISSFGGGLAVNCQSSEDIAKGLLELYSSWKEGLIEERFGSERLFKQYAPETIIAAYEKIFKKL